MSTRAVFRRTALAAAGCSTLLVLAALTPLSASADTASLPVTVSTGEFSHGLAMDTDDHRVFVTNPASRSVSSFDGWVPVPTVQKITVGEQPRAIAVDSRSNLVFVANSGDGTVSWFDGSADHPTVSTITVGGEPSGVAIDEATGTVFVSNATDNSVAFISEGEPTGAQGSVRVGREPAGLVVDGETHQVLVANQGDNTVSRFLSPTAPGSSGATPVVSTIPVGGRPTGITVDAGTGTAFVSNFDSDSISVFSATSPSPVVRTVAVGSSPSGITVDARSHLVFVSDFRGAEISQFDGTAASPLVIRVPAIKAPWGIAVDPQSGSVYVANRLNSFVSRIRPAVPEAAHITTTAVQPATVGANYFQPFAVSGNPRPSLSIVGDLPEGISFDSANGYLIGLPGAVSSTRLTLHAENGVGTPSEFSFTLVVNPTAPVLVTSGELAQGRVGMSYRVALAAPGSSSSRCTLSGRAPVGLSGCVLTGAPTAAGDYSFSVTSTNAGGSVSQSYEIIVLPAGTGGGCPGSAGAAEAGGAGTAEAGGAGTAEAGGAGPWAGGVAVVDGAKPGC